MDLDAKRVLERLLDVVDTISCNVQELRDSVDRSTIMNHGKHCHCDCCLISRELTELKSIVKNANKL